MVKKGSKGKGKAIDEEQTLKEIVNPEFVAMRQMQKQFPKPTTQEADLASLVEHGLLQEPTTHRSPIDRTSTDSWWLEQSGHNLSAVAAWERGSRMRQTCPTLLGETKDGLFLGETKLTESVSLTPNTISSRGLE